MYIIFFMMWIVFNGKITLEIIIFGLVIAALLYLFICKFMDYSIRKDIAIAKETGLILKYIGILLLEIIKANMATIKTIMSSKYQNEPKLIHFKTNLKTKTAKVILANSITLTPGTITVSLEDDEYVVHCLDKEFAKGIEDSTFIQMLTQMENIALEQLQKSGKGNKS